MTADGPYDRFPFFCIYRSRHRLCTPGPVLTTTRFCAVFTSYTNSSVSCSMDGKWISASSTEGPCSSPPSSPVPARECRERSYLGDAMAAAKQCPAQILLARHLSRGARHPGMGRRVLFLRPILRPCGWSLFCRGSDDPQPQFYMKHLEWTTVPTCWI